jgi:AhpD family alkylhydroperoxidase
MLRGRRVQPLDAGGGKTVGERHLISSGRVVRIRDCESVPDSSREQRTGDTQMSDAIPAGRMRLPEIAGRQYGGMYRLQRSIELDHAIHDLVALRASQLNGCAFCIDMHWKDARARGETEERLYMLDAWRESTLYDEREQAALALCEAMTLITDGHVPDHVWERASAEFDEYELSQVVFEITAINAWNRLMITTRTEAGHYQPSVPSPAPPS